MKLIYPNSTLASSPNRYHYWSAWFEENGYTEPQCLQGTTLRHPVSLFVSMFWWCRGLNCPREKPKNIDQGCGFFLCTGELKRDYEARTKSLSLRGAAGGLTMRQFLERSDEWAMGINIMTRFLGAPSADMSAEYQRVPRLTNATAEGRHYFQLAKRRLMAMDFVLLVEFLQLGYAEYFSVSVPHSNSNSKTNKTVATTKIPKFMSRDQMEKRSYDPKNVLLTPEERRKIEELNDLDMALYDFAKSRYTPRPSLSPSPSSYLGSAAAVLPLLRPRAPLRATPDTMPARAAGNWYWKTRDPASSKFSGSEEHRRAAPAGTGTCRQAMRRALWPALTPQGEERHRQREKSLLLEQQKLFRDRDRSSGSMTRETRRNSNIEKRKKKKGSNTAASSSRGGGDLNAQRAAAQRRKDANARLLAQ
jgi:hypothetical protein